MTDEKPKTRTSAVVAARMKELDLDIRRVAADTKATYEHVRKIVRGGAFPSRYYLLVLCDVLKLDVNEMERLVAMDKIESKVEQNWGDMGSFMSDVRRSKVA
jgi:hypothetical protein